MVQLVPMTEDDFQRFYERAIRNYAEEKTQAGNYSPEEALEGSRREFEELLPNGLSSKDNHLFMIVDETGGQKVGHLWFNVRQKNPPTAFIYDVEVFQEFRRRGYAEQAFLRLEENVKELGLAKIGLHVFGHNHAARALYEKLGYEITNINMAKALN